MEEIEEKVIISLIGFEPGNEPEIRIMTDDTIYLVFNFFPPLSFDMSGRDIDHFEWELSSFLNTQVLHEDREFFLIQYPKTDTVARLKHFVESYRVWKGYSNSSNTHPFDPDLLAGFGLH